MLLDLLGINKVIKQMKCKLQKLEKNTISDSRPYKVYTALLSQTGTDAPIATVLENTLGGTVVWSYEVDGVYSATLNNAFTSSTFIQISNGNMNNYISYSYRQDVNSIYVETYDLTVNAATNGVLIQATIEIRVYN